MVKAPKKAKAPLPPRPNTAVYVTGLPSDVTVEEVHDVFSRKCGVIAEEIDSGKPRIKLYTDEKGEFKGDALIVFFKAPSVDMAIMLLDDTDFRIEGGSSKERIKMRVQAAEASYKKVQQIDADGKEKEKPKTSMKDKQKIIKKTQKLDARLADWSDDEPSALVETSSRWDKVVILKHMFTLKELEEDPAAILDIKEDIREECGKLGEVTNVVLYDLEKDGVASVRFANTESAKACVRLMNGRKFDGQEVEAYITDGKEQFKKSKKKADDEDLVGSESDWLGWEWGIKLYRYYTEVKLTMLATGIGISMHGRFGCRTIWNNINDILLFHQKFFPCHWSFPCHRSSHLLEKHLKRP